MTVEFGVTPVPLMAGLLALAPIAVVLVVGAAGVMGATANAVTGDAGVVTPVMVEVAVKLWLPIAIAVVVW